MDIMDNPDESFDVIYCSHVLEHVPDDRKAMREFPRVLKRGGWAILLVPINAGKTYEDASITEPQSACVSSVRGTSCVTTDRTTWIDYARQGLL